MKTLQGMDRWLVIGILVGGIASAGCERPQQTGAQQIDKEAVARVDNAYATAWLSGDSEQVMTLFTADAVISPSGMASIKGADAMRAFWWPPDAPPTKVTAFSLTQESIDGSGDMAVVRGQYTMQFTYEDSAQTRRGDYHTILARGPDGNWRITFRAWNDLSDETI